MVIFKGIQDQAGVSKRQSQIIPHHKPFVFQSVRGNFSFRVPQVKTDIKSIKMLEMFLLP